jgi:hypothetical protein
MTAVDESRVIGIPTVDVIAAPTGNLGATALILGAAGRRTGAKASEADHPSDCDDSLFQ